MFLWTSATSYCIDHGSTIIAHFMMVIRLHSPFKCKDCSNKTYTWKNSYETYFVWWGHKHFLRSRAWWRNFVGWDYRTHRWWGCQRRFSRCTPNIWWVCGGCLPWNNLENQIFDKQQDEQEGVAENQVKTKLVWAKKQSASHDFWRNSSHVQLCLSILGSSTMHGSK